MEPSQFRKYRILFVKSSCIHCRKYLEFIERINLKLPIDKRIKIIDCTMAQYGIIDNPLIVLLDKQIEGYPTLIFDGLKISGINSAIETKVFLETYLNKEFIVYEDNNFMFNSDCEFKKGGLFNKKVVCKN